jgi:hypothetical protein
MALSGGNKGGGRAKGMGGARGVSAKVRLRHDRLDELTRMIADGATEAGKAIVEIASANAPDSPYEPYPTGEGLPRQGGVLTYVNGDKVDGWSIRGPQPAKPRAAKLIVKAHSVTTLIGFGFPGRSAEGGTLRQPARPFLAPARDQVGAEGIANIIGAVVRPQLGRAK